MDQRDLHRSSIVIAVSSSSQPSFFSSIVTIVTVTSFSLRPCAYRRAILHGEPTGKVMSLQCLITNSIFVYAIDHHHLLVACSVKCSKSLSLNGLSSALQTIKNSKGENRMYHLRHPLSWVCNLYSIFLMKTSFFNVLHA